jgi:cytochrome c-type biogenesis protein CcmF
MIRELGYASILVALVLSVVGTVLAAMHAARQGSLSKTAQAMAYTIFGLLTVSTVCMVTGLVTNDFSISYVAQVGSIATPLHIKIISLWSALEGSILFWGFVLTLYMAAVLFTQRKRTDAVMGYALATMLGVTSFFLILLALPANPFGAVFPTPADGPGPNPLLQNHILMAVHPPLLYLGYVGMTVPFAFAIGSLAAGRIDDDWSKNTRRWTVFSWTMLSAAIIAGMWWSYEVLGWGGYWAWDPVENASFMPWLTATAFLHSTMVEERRGMLKGWNIALIISTFILTILGTFLTRSGILSSVHSFTSGPIGYYFLSFIAVTLVFSLTMLAGRAEKLGSEARLDSMASRETVFLFNNLVLAVFTFTVLLGTLFPLVAEAARGVKVSVGAPFFNKMTLPLCVALVFLMGVGPALPWRRADADDVKRRLRVPATVLGIALLVTLAFTRQPYVVLGFAFVAFALTTTLQEFWKGIRGRMQSLGEPALVAFGRLFTTNPRRYGGYVAHVGVFMVCAGIVASATYTLERDVTLKKGESVAVGPYTVGFSETWGREEPHRFVVGADMIVKRGDTVLDTIAPKMNFYNTQQQPIPTPAVRSTMRDDVYLTLMAFERDGSQVTVRAFVEPLVWWIWYGGMVVMAGGLIALYPAKRRPRKGPPARAARPRPAAKPARELEEVGA